MVIDIVDGKKIPRYLVYDIISLMDQNIGCRDFFPHRLKAIERDIIIPRHKAIEKGYLNKNLEPFSIRPKHFWSIFKARDLLSEKFSKSLSHEPDGLIFQPSSEPYIAGRCDDVLKWKPLSLNSVDFKLKIIVEGGVGYVTLPILPETLLIIFVFL